jgi:hypothetical protein
VLIVLKVVILLVVLCVPLASQQVLSNGKTDFSGSWELKKDGQPGAVSKLLINQREDEVHIRDSDVQRDMQTNLKCGTKGVECKARVDGRDARVTLWYNGPSLVEMETIGDDVRKKRLTLSEDGKTLTLEVVSIVPAGKDAEKLVFSRAVTGEQHAGGLKP